MQERRMREKRRRRKRDGGMGTKERREKSKRERDFKGLQCPVDAAAATAVASIDQLNK